MIKSEDNPRSSAWAITRWSARLSLALSLSTRLSISNFVRFYGHFSGLEDDGEKAFDFQFAQKFPFLSANEIFVRVLSADFSDADKEMSLKMFWNFVF